VTAKASVYSAISTRHNAPQAGADPLGRIGTCSFQVNQKLQFDRYSSAESNLGVLMDSFNQPDRPILPFGLNGPRRRIMLYWALVFLVIALIAGVLGFTGVAVAAAGIAKVLFVIFLVLFLISLVTHFARGATR
jgi:uncharacterized membrane protein YtjA (UPF0391 family)